MHKKWKFIIKNWITYFNDSNILDQNVSKESLLNIITHLRENWNESNSSSLSAQTVEEFIVEKYSAFKFENGTVLPSNEEEIYLAASLLLFFVCVNSKDMELKSAMCSNLSREDQEVILRFTKSLMECSPVTRKDVQAAITDACGIELASLGSSSCRTMVTETPPVLRSLHSEVRRLQSALEAERFDRNFLQEELTRTNLRMDKLLQDKEQYKLEIVDLRTKISMCCGKEEDSVGETNACVDSAAKFVKQLQEMEERLVRTQEQLDEMTHARETYKAKVEELKLDRIKWLSLSQQESTRANLLSEELETKRQQVQSLHELVAELRQHNRLNGLDSSQLECDDADSSMQSVQHNLSVCSEACANVVEVQLAEERAKIAALKQQIQCLQDQLNVLSQKTETDKKSYEKILSERDNEIFNLKHRINEEIEEKNNLKVHFNDEVIKLHNEMNELEQKAKDNKDSFRQTIEQKMREIQILQEEKLSLLQSLSDETTKLEKIIQQLKSDIENEKQIKNNMKEGYESHIMNLNEKILNRNNELVEFQNNVCEKSEMIESLHIKLRNEREYKEKLTIQFHEEKHYLNEHIKRLEGYLQKQTEEINVMQQNFEQRTSVILNEIAHFKNLTSNWQEQCHDLETTKERLKSELSTITIKLVEVEKEMKNVKNSFSEEQERLKHQLDEKNAIITTLQTHLQDEIHFKIRLQDELQKLQAAKMLLSEEMVNLNMLLLRVQTDLTEKDKTVETIGLSLKEEKLITENLRIDNSKLVDQINKLTQQFTEKNNNIVFLNSELETYKITSNNNIQDKDEIIKNINNKLYTEMVNKETSEKKIGSLSKEISNLEIALNKRCNEISQLQTKCDDYENKTQKLRISLNETSDSGREIIYQKDNMIKELNEKNNSLTKELDLARTLDNEKSEEIQGLQKSLIELNDTRRELVCQNEIIIIELNKKITDQDSLNDKLELELKKAIEERQLAVEALQKDIEKLHLTIEEDNSNHDVIVKQKDKITEKQEQELKQRALQLESIGKDYEGVTLNWKKFKMETQENIENKDKQITELNAQLGLLKQDRQQEELNKTVEHETQERNEFEQRTRDEILKLLESLKLEKSKYMDVILDQEELNEQLSSILNSGLESLVKILQKEVITNEILQKLVAIQTNDIPTSEKCDTLIELANNLSNELAMRKNIEKVHEKSVNTELHDVVNQKEIQIFELQTEIKRLQQLTNENKIELSKLNETYTTAFDNKDREIQLLQQQNQSLTNDLNDVKLQLEIKAHSLKEKLIDKENLTEKLKRTYEAQIDNLNVMITKLTSYLKDKASEIETARKEKERLQQVIEENTKAVKKLEDELKTEKQNGEKLIYDFESERQVLKNMVTVTESVMEDQKLELNKAIEDHLKANEKLQEENSSMKELADKLNDEIKRKLSEIDELKNEIKTLSTDLKKSKEDINALERQNTDLLKEKESVTYDLQSLKHKLSLLDDIENKLQEKTQAVFEFQEKNKLLDDQILILGKEKNDFIEEKLKVVEKLNEEISILKTENTNLVNVIEENKTVITKLELLIKHELEQNKQLCENAAKEKLNFANQCPLLQERITKSEVQLQKRQEEIETFHKDIETLQTKVKICEEELRAKDGFISKITKDKDAVIGAISKELLEEKATNEKYKKELEVKTATINELKNMDDLYNERETLKILRKENEELIKAIGQRETFAVQEKISAQKQTMQAQREIRDLHHQLDNSSSDMTQSSLESLKTITDLEKIIDDKNRTITTLQSDVTYLKTLMAESETKLMDVTKDLEVSKENYQQLSSQLKKMVHQKNDEIADLKKELSKMSATENRATQIIKVSAKYQAIILKRIAELKTNTVLKELTNFGNSNNCDNELKRSLNSGSITMEDLENFLENTDRHLKRCTEKQTTLQKERDRLADVNKIHESEIINAKKFLTELSVGFQTFSSIKDLYVQKLSRVVSVQRTVRREILNSEGRITDVCMCKLERGYSAFMQDLAECAMTLQRWAEQCLGRALSPEKLKQAFMRDVDRASLSPVTFQNSGLEIQLEELENSFQKLLAEVSRALKGEGAKDPQAVTVMEVRAEYEDKLNRMKAKMKQLYVEQISVFKEKQKDELAALENELQKARDKLAESSKAYEEHIRGLTTELWSVGEKFLIKKDEAEWLRRKHKSGSLMSLQHVHSSGLLPPQEESSGLSDTQSLRSLSVNNNTNKRDGRGLHVSDEEGEVFDNRCLSELGTPRREVIVPGQRISELQWRNSLCPPHLKSSYPAETQFTPALDENDIKCIGTSGASGVRRQRKEVGIIAYKKPGPPTPSKQAGRLSATDSELRESLRMEAEPHPRKTSTPSRIRALFRSSRTDTIEGTPRSKRLSNIFRKK